MVNRYETPTSNSQELSRGSSLVVSEIKRGWFKDKVENFKIIPLSNKYYVPDKPDRWEKGIISDRKGLIRLEPTQWRKSGFILIGLLIVLLTIVIAVWKRKKNSYD